MPCNPVNISEPQGPWNCSTELDTNPHDWPKTCESTWKGVEGICYESSPKYSIENTTLANCCDEAGKHGSGLIHGVNEWTYYHDNSTCHLFNIIELHPPTGPGNCTLGVRSSFFPKPCDCERVHKSVGKEYLYQTYG
jgi:hypothetical protein